MSVSEQGGSRLESLTPDVCRRLLRRHRFGRIAVTDPEGPVVFPVNYRMDGTTVVFRSGRGTKLDAAVVGAPATFEIDGVDPVHRIGWSVLARGVVEEVTDPTELRRLEALPIDAYPEGARSRMVRIRDPRLTGRRIPVPAEVAEAWLEQPEVGNVWYDRDGTDLLG